ncbi:PadR family transcriptional regulator [Mesoterricola silvestris]|uniref:PadR family transcriptional regulator n=1 Tax=Mesoterricola silvestris TaxID=2927979 RepID=A0AA48GL30_9BACT|nr:PadR family transcriptional regulator [Mesoterricola silvestris]BDU73209.1 PadR family transcriptional regulator [Mesoterricola silvestris]
MPRTRAPFTLELTLIGILDRTPMHGYNLCKAVQALDGFDLVWKVKQSALYALVDKLEAQGLLESDLIPGESHPSRKELRVTPAGRAALDAWVDTPVESVRQMRQDFFGRLYFARLSGPDRARRLIRAQHQACQAWLRHLQGRLETEPGDYLHIVLSHRLQIVQATLAWLKDCEASLPRDGTRT